MWSGEGAPARMEFRCDAATLDAFTERLQPVMRFMDRDEPRRHILVPMPGGITTWPKLVMDEPAT